MTIDLSAGGYATVSDLGAWLVDAPPGNAVQLLRSATFLIGEASNRNPYADAPTADDAVPLRDATCAQAASWIALGLNPDAVGIDGPAPVKRSTMLSATVEFDTSARDEARSVAARELAPLAESILQGAGLLWVPVPVADTSGWLPSYGLDDRRWWSLMGSPVDGFPWC